MPQRQDVGWRFRFRIEQAWQVDASGQNRAIDLDTELPSQVYLGWYGQEGRHDSGWNMSALPEPVKAGERWRLRVRLKAPHGHLNPRGFDYELWLWEQNIRATGYVRTGVKDPSPERLARTGRHTVESWRQSVRDRLLTHLATSPGGAATVQHSGVVAALVTGDQAAIDRSEWDLFRATGVSHLMSISGLHVTMFAWLASLVVAWGWRRLALWGFAGALRWPAPEVGALAGLVLAGFYALFSGWGVPAQRTMWMLAVVVVLKLSARLWPGHLVWSLAGAVVLTWDPWAMLQPGFWLSFVAVGVLMATGHAWDPGQKQRVGGSVWPGRAFALVREQFIVTVALAPLGLLFFGQVSWVGLIANLLAIPWVTFLVTPLAMLGVVWSGAWELAVWALQPLTMVLSWMASWPQPVMSTAIAPWSLAVLALVGAVVLVLKAPLSWKLLCLPLLWPVLFWQAPRPAAGNFELLAADVGQGNAVLVRTARHSLLYDAGPRYSSESDAGHRVLVPLLAQSGERLNMLMLSHRDSDHTGGAAAVLSMQPQAALWSSLEEGHPLHSLRPDWRRCQAGQSWIWDGVLFEVLHPPALATGKPLDKKTKPNALSCVLRISQGTASALLAGDIEAPQELALVASGLLPVNLLLVPHHGSKTSSTGPFIEALQPQVAVVQAGYRNRYGHPAESVVERYRALGVDLVENTRCGAARWLSSKPEVVHCEREWARRYWHHIVPP
jgi:competence protein ComEC